VFARISTFEGPSEQTAEGIRVARRQFLPAARLQEGFRGMYLMLDAANGRSLAMTFWETEEDMARSESAVRRARTESAEAAGDTVVSVERYEVAFGELVGS
jgi:heme-degrading monooxygenase HmoA